MSTRKKRSAKAGDSNEPRPSDARILPQVSWNVNRGSQNCGPATRVSGPGTSGTAGPNDGTRRRLCEQDGRELSEEDRRELSEEDRRELSEEDRRDLSEENGRDLIRWGVRGAQRPDAAGNGSGPPLRYPRPRLGGRLPQPSYPPDGAPQTPLRLIPIRYPGAARLREARPGEWAGPERGEDERRDLIRRGVRGAQRPDAAGNGSGPPLRYPRPRLGGRLPQPSYPPDGAPQTPLRLIPVRYPGAARLREARPGEWEGPERGG